MEHQPSRTGEVLSGLSLLAATFIFGIALFFLLGGLLQAISGMVLVLGALGFYLVLASIFKSLHLFKGGHPFLWLAERMAGPLAKMLDKLAEEEERDGEEDVGEEPDRRGRRKEDRHRRFREEALGEEEGGEEDLQGEDAGDDTEREEPGGKGEEEPEGEKGEDEEEGEEEEAGGGEDSGEEGEENEEEGEEASGKGKEVPWRRKKK